jgi:hypothetical protein
MTDEIENAEVEEDLDLYDLLGLVPPEEDPEVLEMEAEQDEALAKADKIEKKLSAKMTDMQRTFDANILKERIKNFQNGATSLEKDLFKTIAADVKKPADLDKALGIVKQQAAELQAQTDAYKAQMEQVAAAEAARAWGTGPIGTPTPRSRDAEEEELKKIAAGDTTALLSSLLGDDIPWQ